eukprot:398983-Prorocentrum_minimum.AAC.1
MQKPIGEARIEYSDAESNRRGLNRICGRRRRSRSTHPNIPTQKPIGGARIEYAWGVVVVSRWAEEYLREVLGSFNQPFRQVCTPCYHKKLVVVGEAPVVWSDCVFPPDLHTTHMLGAGANCARVESMYPEREPIARGWRAYTGSGSQSREGGEIYPEREPIARGWRAYTRSGSQ